jgi:Fe2+ or Zn2+ uptake regulation protein
MVKAARKATNKRKPPVFPIRRRKPPVDPSSLRQRMAKIFCDAKPSYTYSIEELTKHFAEASPATVRRTLSWWLLHGYVEKSESSTFGQSTYRRASKYAQGQMP